MKLEKVKKNFLAEEEAEMQEVSIDQIDNELPDEPEEPPAPPTITEKPITTTLSAANRIYEDSVPFEVRDRISSQVNEASKAVSDVTDNVTRQASAGVRDLLGIKQTEDTNQQVQEEGVQQGGGIIPAAISPIGGLPQMSPVTINVINGGSDSGPAPVNQNGGKKQASQDGGDIFNFKGGFSKQPEGGDGELEVVMENKKVVMENKRVVATVK